MGGENFLFLRAAAAPRRALAEVVVGDDAVTGIVAAVEHMQVVMRRQRLADLDAAHAVAVAVEPGRVAAEPEPRKDANPTFPLMGAPVHNWYLRNVPETTLGVRTVVRMYFTLEKGDPPATQSLTLSLGGVTAPLTLYLGFNGYLSADLILASAGTGGTGTTSR